MHLIITSELLSNLRNLIIKSRIFIYLRNKYLKYYSNRKLNDAQSKIRKSLGEVDGSSDGGASPQMPRSQSGISMRSRRSIPSQKSTSRTSVDEPLCISAELHDLPEGSESGDSETATEVDVSIVKNIKLFERINDRLKTKQKYH